MEWWFMLTYSNVNGTQIMLEDSSKKWQKSTRCVQSSNRIIDESKTRHILHESLNIDGLNNETHVFVKMVTYYEWYWVPKKKKVIRGKNEVWTFTRDNHESPIAITPCSMSRLRWVVKHLYGFKLRRLSSGKTCSTCWTLKSEWSCTWNFEYWSNKWWYSHYEVWQRLTHSIW
jgi:hypothetical protein